jgi:hypothetical protein
MYAADWATSHPTLIMRSTPASLAAATCSAARTGSRSRWQWSSVQRTVTP